MNKTELGAKITMQTKRALYGLCVACCYFMFVPTGVPAAEHINWQTDDKAIPMAKRAVMKKPTAAHPHEITYTPFNAKDKPAIAIIKIKPARAFPNTICPGLAGDTNKASIVLV